MNIAECLGSPVLKNICDQLLLSHVNFGTINLKQSGFCRTCYFKILVSEQKYKIKRPPLKIIQKIVNLKKKKKKQQFSCTLFLYKHMGKLGRSSICLRLAQFEPEIMLDGMLNFKTHFKV